ncbi:hypothetical protein [Polaribacter filamentus]
MGFKNMVCCNLCISTDGLKETFTRPIIWKAMWICTVL